MKLVDLEPQFERYETRDIDGAPREVSVRVDTLPEAQGVRFLCPSCYEKNGGPVGTHAVRVTFAGAGALDTQGSHGREGTPSRWTVSGSGIGDLTLTPSIDLTPGCTRHGYITNGAIA